MKRYLLDTSIVVFLFRGKHDITSRLNKIGTDACFVSDVTIAELTFGAYHSDRVQWNLSMIDQFVKAVNIVPFAECINEYARQKDMLIRKGQMIEDFDLLIGCTAVSLGLTMVTDNIKHFSRIENLEIENWVTR